MEQDLGYLVWKDVKTGNKYKVLNYIKKMAHFILSILLRMLKKPKKIDLNY